MKKIVVGISFACLVISCRKVQAGGNTAILKLEAGQEKYTDQEVTDKVSDPKSTATKGAVLGPEMNNIKKTSVLSGAVKKDSAATLTVVPEKVVVEPATK